MDKLARLRHYTAVYYAHATQHRTSRAAREWMEAEVPAAEAARWANAGYLPAEAEPLIADGVTPETATEMDQLADDLAGGPEARAMQVIDAMVADGTLVDPARVRQVQDPDDPTHTIVWISPDA
ncbi:hypothetical protein ACGFIW_01615 [Micromonospora sp. NPDC048935]|uniref:hypothetical protein n=1 Tax=Micromonospora sp. NPDC048935 TaxID=3364262 RepID=UPI003713CFF6